MPAATLTEIGTSVQTIAAPLQRAFAPDRGQVATAGVTTAGVVAADLAEHLAATQLRFRERGVSSEEFAF